MFLHLKRLLALLLVSVVYFAGVGVSQAGDMDDSLDSLSFCADVSYDSFSFCAESSLFGSSFIEESFWLVGLDLYNPISRSVRGEVFQNGNLQGSGDFNERDVDFGLSVYRYWGPWFFGMQLGGPSRSVETALRLALHSTYLDTSLKLKRRAFGALMFGYSFNPLEWASMTSLSFASMESLSFLHDMSFALAGGVRYTREELELKSDETPGGGRPERFSTRESKFNPVVKAFLRIPLMAGNSFTDSGAEFQIGLERHRVSGSNVTGRSSTFNFPYEADMDSEWVTSVTSSFVVRF